MKYNKIQKIISDREEFIEDKFLEKKFLQELEILIDLYQNTLLKQKAIINRNYVDSAKYRGIERSLILKLLTILNLEKISHKKYYGLEDYYEEKYGMEFPSLNIIRQIKLEKIL
jgi:hypothetical protein